MPFLSSCVWGSFKAWSTRWWMAHYQSRTPKRHIAWSNSSKIGLFNMGRLTGFDYQSAEYKKHKTATTKVSKSGKKSFQGRKKELKASQCLRRKFTSKGAHAFIYIYIPWPPGDSQCALVLDQENLYGSFSYAFLRGYLYSLPKGYQRLLYIQLHHSFFDGCSGSADIDSSAFPTNYNYVSFIYIHGDGPSVEHRVRG